uniref:Uncharacterized protein n=1 Tax=Peronospora matthiolae TaxID=2874970 RepID=A0AAV1V9R3_9STRA
MVQMTSRSSSSTSRRCSSHCTCDSSNDSPSPDSTQRIPFGQLYRSKRVLTSTFGENEEKMTTVFAELRHMRPKLKLGLLE